VIVTADADFGAILATRHLTGPSVILFRRWTPRRAESIAALILENLPKFNLELERGCIVVIDQARIRIRMLPVSDDRAD
jgi:predicted nuclease of predicted toxin-antitoxin system